MPDRLQVQESDSVEFPVLLARLLNNEGWDLLAESSDRPMELRDALLGLAWKRERDA